MSTEQDGRDVSRRGFLRTGALAAGTAATAAGTAAAQETEGDEETTTTTPEPTPTTREVPDFDGYLDDVSNYDGTLTDATGQGEVTVRVGTQGNGGFFAFEPAAIQIDPGTTIVWEWTGEGVPHNVVDEGGAFESELLSETGATYQYTFEETGVFTYFCDPHKALGMKAAVVVGDEYPTKTVEITPSGGDGGEGGDGGGTPEPNAGNQTAANTLLVMLGLGFLSPVLFAILLRWRRPSSNGE